MGNLHVEGQPCKAADVRSLLFGLANKVKGATGIFGSVDADQFGLQSVFSWGGQVVTITYCDMDSMKGGRL